MGAEDSVLQDKKRKKIIISLRISLSAEESDGQCSAPSFVEYMYTEPGTELILSPKNRHSGLSEIQEKTMMTFTFGLTGGICCGKSTVSAFLAQMGVPMLDADQISREIVEPGEPALQEIAEAFGSDIIREDGFLDRRKLGERVMSNPSERKILEAITHPRIQSRTKEKIKALEAKRKVAVIVEAALLIETGGYKNYHGLILVTCSRKVQLNRLMERENFDEETAQKWIDSQMLMSEKEKIAQTRRGSWIIENNGSIEQL